jgi:hypothetical protein
VEFVSVDKIPLKIGKWNGMYGQQGRLHPLNNTRAVYFPELANLAEIERALVMTGHDELDWITAGSLDPERIEV